MPAHSNSTRSDGPARAPRIAAELRSPDDASNGWFESTWELRRGLDVCEGLLLEQGNDEGFHAGRPPAQQHPASTNHSGVEVKGYFHLTLSGAARYSFELKAGNHEVILTSRFYKTKEDALEAVDSVRKNSVNPLRYERKLTTDNSPYFLLLADDGETLGKSEMYLASSARENGIASVMSNGPTTSIQGLE